MVISREKTKNIILSCERGFRTQTARLFGEVGFPGEKLFTTTFEEALATLRFDRSALNISIAQDNLDFYDYVAQLAHVDQFIAGTQIMALAYFRVESAKEMTEVKSSLANLNLRLLPVKKVDFIAVFKSFRATSIESFNPPSLEKVTEENRKNVDGKLLNFYEASAHLRECIKAANSLIERPDQIPLLVEIGQKFNALVGTYTFFQTKDGYKELYHLGIIVDNLSRTYGKKLTQDQAAIIDSRHIELLIQSMKCAFTLLKILREGGQPDREQTNLVMELFETYSKDGDIEKRKLESQDEIEALLEQWRAS